MIKVYTFIQVDLEPAIWIDVRIDERRQPPMIFFGETVLQSWLLQYRLHHVLGNSAGPRLCTVTSSVALMARADLKTIKDNQNGTDGRCSAVIDPADGEVGRPFRLSLNYLQQIEKAEAP